LEGAIAIANLCLRIAHELRQRDGSSLIEQRPALQPKLPTDLDRGKHGFESPTGFDPILRREYVLEIPAA